MSDGAGWNGAIVDSLIAHVLDTAEIGLFQIDAATGLATWDKVASSILGFGGVEQLEPASMPIHPDDLDDVRLGLE